MPHESPKYKFEIQCLQHQNKTSQSCMNKHSSFQNLPTEASLQIDILRLISNYETKFTNNLTTCNICTNLINPVFRVHFVRTALLKFLSSFPQQGRACFKKVSQITAFITKATRKSNQRLQTFTRTCFVWCILCGVCILVCYVISKT